MTYLVQSHHYNMLYEKQKQKEWAKDSFASASHKIRDLAGQRLGVLGYGSIGRQGIFEHPISATFSYFPCNFLHNW